MQRSGIVVNSCQKGNQLLKYFHNIPWEYSNEISCDYQVGRHAGLLFLSLKFHQLKASYITQRIGDLKTVYSTRILLCLVDVKEYENLLFEVTNVAIQTSMTLMLCWSWEEAAKIIENFKAFEYKPADLLKPKVESGIYARAEDFLKATQALNKTDIMILASKFKTLGRIVHADQQALKSCQGIGPTKCEKLNSVFTSEFRLE